MKKRNIILVLLGAVFAAFLAAVLYILSTPLDLSQYHTRIESIIESATGQKVTAQTIIFKALPRTEITLKDVSAFKDKEAFLNIRSVRIALPLFDLFSKTPRIKRLDVENAILRVKRERDGKLNLAGFFAPAGPIGWKPLIRSLDLKNSALSFTDEAAGASYGITGISAQIKKTLTGLDFNAHARLLPDTGLSLAGTAIKDEMGVRLDGKAAIKNLEIGVLNPYIKAYSPDASARGKADAELSFQTDSNSIIKGLISYKGVEARYPAVFNRPLNSPAGSAEMIVLIRDKEVHLSVNKASARMEGFNITGSFKVKGPWGSGKNAFELKASTTPVPLKTIEELVSLKALPPNISAQAEKFTPLGGDLTVKELTLSGTLDDLKDKNAYKRQDFFNIKAGLNNLEFKYSALKETFSDVKGEFSMAGDRLSIRNLSGLYDKGNIENLAWEIKDLYTKPLYSLTLKASFEADETLGIVKRLFEGEKGVLIEKMEKAETSGRTDLSLDIKGGFDEKTPVIYSVRLELLGVKLQHPELPSVLTGLKGGIDFDNSRITFKDLRGEDSFHSEFALSGFLEDYSAKKPFFNIKAEGALARATLQPFVKGRFLEALLFNGAIPFWIKASGRFDSLAAEAFINFTPSNLEYKKVVKKARDYPAFLTCDLKLDKGEVAINRLNVSVKDSSINAAGSFFIDRPVYRLSISSRQVSIDDLDDVSPYFVAGFNSSGTLSFNALAARTEKDTAPFYEGDVTIKDGRFNSTLLARPVERISGSLKLHGNELSIIADNVTAGSTEISGKIDIPDVSGRIVRFEINSPRFYLEDLVSRTKVSATEEKAKLKRYLHMLLNPEEEAGKKEEAAGKPLITGYGTLRIEKGDIYGNKFEDFYAEARLGREIIALNPIRFMKDGGSVNGTLGFYRDPSNPVLFNSVVKVSGVQLEPFFVEFGAKEKFLSGPLDGTAEINGRRDAPKFTAGLYGEIHLRANHGRLWKFVVLNRIFTIVNIISIDKLFDEGLPYRHIKGDITIKDGVISTNNLRLDSDSVRMSAVGDVNLPDAYIDSVVGIHPFVTIDKIVTSIPLAGWIIGGRHKSTVSMYYEITGPLANPNVDPVPIKGLQEGVFGILQRLLEAPGEVIKGEP